MITSHKIKLVLQRVLLLTVWRKIRWSYKLPFNYLLNTWWFSAAKNISLWFDSSQFHGQSHLVWLCRVWWFYLQELLQLRICFEYTHHSWLWLIPFSHAGCLRNGSPHFLLRSGANIYLSAFHLFFGPGMESLPTQLQMSFVITRILEKCALAFLSWNCSVQSESLESEVFKVGPRLLTMYTFEGARSHS
jgi:hypothetical protein